MEQKLQQWITDILYKHPEVIELALKKRSKFEGWLKLELAAKAIQQHDISHVAVEETYGPNNYKADLSFQFDGNIYYIEMKTPHRIGWMVKEDTRKLKTCEGQGILVFALFPVPHNNTDWQQDCQLWIANIANITVDWKRYCTQLPQKLSDGSICDIVIGCINIHNNG